MFRVMESLCLQGNKVMEDRVGWGEDYLFVIDGASGLTPTHVTPGDSDAAWLAEGLRQRLCDLLPGDLPLPRIMEEAAGELMAEYRSYCPQSAPSDPPSAGVTVFRLRGGWMEYFGLGDCSATVERRDGSVEALCESRLTALDHAALDQLSALCREKGYTMRQARNALSHVILANRELRNHPDGYWIFDPPGTGVPHGRKARWAAADVRSVALMSDGFAQLIDPFAVAADPADLHRKIRKQGLKALADQLFRLQQEDRDCLDYPRFKLRDDTTALWAVVE